MKWSWIDFGVKAKVKNEYEKKNVLNFFFCIRTTTFHTLSNRISWARYRHHLNIYMQNINQILLWSSTRKINISHTDCVCMFIDRGKKPPLCHCHYKHLLLKSKISILTNFFSSLPSKHNNNNTLYVEPRFFLVCIPR